LSTCPSQPKTKGPRRGAINLPLSLSAIANLRARRRRRRCRFHHHHHRRRRRRRRRRRHRRRRDVTDTIPCGALAARGRSFVNYLADRVIRCGENREKDGGGDQWEAKGERTRCGCAYDAGHVGETQRDTRRAHSWVSRHERVTTRSAHVLCDATPRRAASRRAPHDALALAPDIGVLDFYSIYTGGSDWNPERNRAHDRPIEMIADR